ncbi:valine--tRNA ligase [Sphingorhabdus contaminans]|uniref:valine--tRNA ligase n=1 Tax=Sphingorhabdus contaminans TaxID=1343899 RepID=UPI003D2DC726
MTIDKTFDPAAIEAKWYAHWESTGAFRPERPDAEPYTIVNPPPNVTGSLHIGHALDNTLQDILIRHARLQGKDALWVVGTDHAGIATQMVVERQMAQYQQKRTDFTRDEFVAKVWEWKEESGGEITRQLRRLGCSMDWENERFTMDEGFSKAVIKVFVDLYNQGLLYRDKRLVNWDPKLKTAISDLEVETREINGGFWHFRYPLADGVRLANGADHIVVATTRPETMLADMAVAVHPDDERYQSVIGKHIEQPITGRRFRIVADEYADPTLGSGAVKITPGHDFNDFELAKRAGYKPNQMLNMFDNEAHVIQTADERIPNEFIGLDRFDARKLVVERMKALNLLVPFVDKDGSTHDAEPRTIQVPFGDRGGVVIEPWLTDQWYVNAEVLAQKPIEAVKSGAIQIVPKSWEKTFFNWMENIQPWCVSRQLWWGHQIPVWYGPSNEMLRALAGGDKDEMARLVREERDQHVFVNESESEALKAAEEYYGDSYYVTVGQMMLEPEKLQSGKRGTAIFRDPDVLDTWFSSALWPFGTLGWPDQTRELDRHYPNDVLVSGFDILFFWDARMAMQGIHFMKEVPWKTLYLHGLVRAADGSKMSKSKGNTVDPLGLIDQYGADALRFFMAAMESQGRDIKMDESRVAGYRNFATKLWNAARFAQSNGIGGSHSISAPKAELAVNRWIIGEVVETVEKLNKAFAEFRFDGMADAIYHFVWDQFCDWYLELIKPAFVDGEKQDMDPESQMVAGWVLDQILVMLHPFMPFVTEELWHALADPASPRAYDLIHAQWPEPKAEVDTGAKAEVEWLIRLVGEVRTAKNELGIAPGAKMDAFVRDASPATEQRIARQQSALARLARLDSVTPGDAPEGGSVQLVVDEATFVLPLAGVIDLDAERARISKAIEAATKEAASLSARLSNAAFVEKAKPEAVEKARADHAEKTAEAERLTAALARLG